MTNDCGCNRLSKKETVIVDFVSIKGDDGHIPEPDEPVEYEHATYELRTVIHKSSIEVWSRRVDKKEVSNGTDS